MANSIFKDVLTPEQRKTHTWANEIDDLYIKLAMEQGEPLHPKLLKPHPKGQARTVTFDELADFAEEILRHQDIVKILKETAEKRKRNPEHKMNGTENIIFDMFTIWYRLKVLRSLRTVSWLDLGFGLASSFRKGLIPDLRCQEAREFYAKQKITDLFLKAEMRM